MIFKLLCGNFSFSCPSAFFLAKPCPVSVSTTSVRQPGFPHQHRLRKQQKREAEKNKTKSELPEFLAGLTKSKYALLKNEDNLNEQQLLKLEQVKLVSPILGKMHELKEEFRNIFEQKSDWLTGLFNLGTWLARAVKYFPESRKTIIRWLNEIIAYFDNRTTSGVVEGY